MVRMRFAAQALDELRKLDPKTPVTLRFIKQLMRTGAIPSVPVAGNVSSGSPVHSAVS